MGIGGLVLGLRGHRNVLAPTGAPAALSVRSGAALPLPLTPSRLVARSAPVWLRIPDIGVSTSLSQLGLNPDGTVQVPTDSAEPGWYRLGPSPGQDGSAVILGHVDSYSGPAVFFRLRTIQPGDQVDVGLSDGVVAQFVVTAVSMYPKASFPAASVYGSHGFSALQLVTCGGTFDSTTGSYLSNVVAYTTLVATSGP